jgi:hypothetical protein
MQTTVKHTKGFVAYLAVGERAVEIRLFPWSFQVHTKRTEFGRRKPKPAQAFNAPPVASALPPVTAPVLPGFDPAEDARGLDATAEKVVGVNPSTLQAPEGSEGDLSNVPDVVVHTSGNGVFHAEHTKIEGLSSTSASPAKARALVESAAKVLAPPEPVLPGFKEPEHPPQSNTALG